MGVVCSVTQPFPYQGSKRRIAQQILAYVQPDTDRLVEPFAGSAAITLAAAQMGRARQFVLNDAHEPLIKLWKTIVDHPEDLADQYQSLWRSQAGREREYYDWVRDRFNEAGEPHHWLYLLARCVKAAVRFNKNGQFNNSPDNRRLGMRPATMRQNLRQTSLLLRGKVQFQHQDYQKVLREATIDDVIYMDPPYQGVCKTRDQRYHLAVDYQDFVASLALLNQRGIPYLVSYDGRTGEKIHGRPLPEELDLTRVEIEAGPSTQATLLGKNETTIESLYLSSSLLKRLAATPVRSRHCSERFLFHDW